MSQVKKSHFQLTILAAAMLSLSACSTTPSIGGIDLGRVGSGISKVGSKTAEIGSSAWEGTKNLLNIGPANSDGLDEVDLALMEDDANIEEVQLTALSSEPLLPKEPLQDTLADSATEFPQQPESDNQLAFGEIPEDVEGDIVVLANHQEDQALPEQSEMQLADAADSVETMDLMHKVAENETLWDIAKKTTGDANNWHVLADINNLAPDASVRVGQTLTIPADMVRPEYSGVEGAVENEIVVAKVDLNIPEKKEEMVVAAAEQIQPEQAQPSAENAAKIMANATAIKVGEGETLWDFAKRTTGDATNWKTIADKNLFGEQQLASIRPGQKIYVPSDMVRERDANGVLIAIGAEGTVPTATAGGVTPANKEAIDASTAVLAGTNTPVAEGDIKIVEAAYQEDNVIKPITAESLSNEAAVAVASNEEKLGKVMVRGTYYPKAVYNDADFSSSLLMRVSPGTQLVVSKAIGPWLEVKTDKGVGYVHSRDIK